MRKKVTVKYYDENTQDWVSDSGMIEDLFDSKEYSDELIIECCKDYLRDCVIDNSNSEEERDKNLAKIENYEFVIVPYDDEY